MNSIKFNEQNVSVFMNYTDLERMMNECVKNTLREIKNEQKKSRNRNGYVPQKLLRYLVFT